MIKLLDKLVKYNANSKDRRTGDCVIRSLSLAFDIDYNRLRSDLNKMKRDSGYATYKSKPIWTEYMKNNIGDRYNEIKLSDDTTVGELSEEISGTIVVLCRDPDPRSNKTHLVTIINHDIYDSWDSSGWIVKSYWEIPSNINVQNIDVTQYYDNINEAIHNAVDKYSRFYKLTGEILRDNISIKNTNEYEVVAKFYYGGMTYGPNDFITDSKMFLCTIKYKFSPVSSDDKNLEIIRKVTLDTVKMFLKNVKTEIDNFTEYAELHSQYDDEFRGSNYEYELRNKLPYWCRKLILNINDERKYGGNFYNYRFQINMQPLPNDPRNDTVTIIGDTWREVLDNLDAYKKDYSRYGYDY